MLPITASDVDGNAELVSHGEEEVFWQDLQDEQDYLFSAFPLARHLPACLPVRVRKQIGASHGRRVVLSQARPPAVPVRHLPGVLALPVERYHLAGAIWQIKADGSDFSWFVGLFLS